VLEDGVVYHTYSTYDRGTDALNATWQLLDRAPKDAVRTSTAGRGAATSMKTSEALTELSRPVAGTVADARKWRAPAQSGRRS
jgi:hypothetical protein